jgi:hypothetical protein
MADITRPEKVSNAGHFQQQERNIYSQLVGTVTGSTL